MPDQRPLQPAATDKHRTAIGIRGFIALVQREAGPDFRKAAILQTLGSLSEALSIALLIPILALMDSESRSLGIPLTGTPLSAMLGPRLEISLPMVLAAFVALIMLRSWALERKEAFTSRVTFGFATRLQVRLFEALAATRWSVVSRWRTADMAHALNTESDKLLFSLNLLLNLTQSVAMTVIFALASLMISWQITLGALAVGGALLLVTIPLRMRSMRHGRTLVSGRQEQYRLADSFFNGLRTAKAFGLETHHLNAMRNVLETMRDGNIGFMALRARAASLYQVATAIALAVFILYSLSIAGASLPATLGLLFLYMRLAPRIMSLHSSAQELVANLGSVEVLLSMLEGCADNVEPPAIQGASPLRLRRQLCLQNLSFTYQNADARAIADVSLTIAAGQITALVGPTGSGKSTLVDVLIGLLEPDTGQVIIDGTPLAPGLSRSWREHVAYVPQESFLFNGSIAANLRMAYPDALDDDLWTALRIADAEALVRALPAGLDHEVGDRGHALSGGERQRIAIARALVRKPDLLIMDEATSALDGLSQRRVAQAIKMLPGGMTVVMIAHRLSLVGYADHIAVLDRGRLIETGTADTIMRSPSGFVRELMDADRLSLYDDQNIISDCRAHSAGAHHPRQ